MTLASQAQLSTDCSKAWHNKWTSHMTHIGSKCKNESCENENHFEGIFWDICSIYVQLAFQNCLQNDFRFDKKLTFHSCILILVVHITSSITIPCNHLGIGVFSIGTSYNNSCLQQCNKVAAIWNKRSWT